MPLLNIIAMTGLNTVLPIAQCWSPGETEEDLFWALSKLKHLMVDANIPPPHVFIHDRDLACMNALV